MAMSASRAGEPAVFAGGSQAVCDSATRLEQPTQKHCIPASQIQGIRENHRVRNGDTPAGLAIPGSLFSASSSHQVGHYQKLLKRKRGKHGPDSRISPTEESAITKAIRTFTSRKGEPVFLPTVGMEFNSAKEAKDFYNLYSWEIGFGIRRGRKKTNDNNYITRQDLVCSCEGLNKREATWRRTGCKAMVRLHRTSDHGWVISQFKMQHNHPCSATNGPNIQWPSHSDIDPMTKDVVQKLRENNRPIDRACTEEDDDTRTFPEAAGGLSPTQMSDGMEEVLGTSGLDTVALKEAWPLCELEPSLRIQRMATPAPVEMEQPLAATEETHPLGSGFSSGGDGDGEDEEDAEEDEEAPYEEPEDPFPGMSRRQRPTEEEMDPNYIPDDEPPGTTSGGTLEMRRRKRPLPTETEILFTRTRQELTDLSREKEEMKAELGKLRGELNLFRSEAERVKKENSQLSQDLEKAITEKLQCRDTYGRARAALRQLKLELDPGEHPQGDDDDSDSSDACLFGRVVERLELVPGVVADQCLKVARFVAQGTVEVVLSHYSRLHPQVGLQLLVQAVLEEDLPPPQTDEAQALHDRVLEGARRIAHQCVQVQAPVQDEEDTSPNGCCDQISSWQHSDL